MDKQQKQNSVHPQGQSTSGIMIVFLFSEDSAFSKGLTSYDLMASQNSLISVVLSTKINGGLLTVHSAGYLLFTIAL